MSAKETLDRIKDTQERLSKILRDAGYASEDTAWTACLRGLAATLVREERGSQR